jgi:tetratricopeptide (TPR) repeat protein
VGAGAVVEGSVAQAGDRVRVTAMLVDARSGLDLWSERFDREVATADLFGLQDDVAQEIVDALRVELAGRERIVARGTRDPDAQRAYFLGVHHWTRRTTHDIALATDYFHEAVAADSLYAEAWAGLALTYVLHRPSEYNVPGLSEDEALDRAEAAALRAIELDATLAEPHAALGEVRRARRDGEGAYREFRVAIEKNPGYATAHHWLADLLMGGLRGEEALAELDLAASLDPVAPAILVERAEGLMMLGRTGQATEQMGHAVELVPDSPLVRQFDFLFAVTLDEWERAAGSFASWLELIGADPDVAVQVASPLLEVGPRERFLEAIAAGEYPDSRVQELAGASALMSPSVRFLAVLKLRGDEAGLDFLEAALSDPALYVPLLPAVMGPELLESLRARDLMASLYDSGAP